MKVRPGRFIVIAAILSLLAFGFYSVKEVVSADEEENTSSASGYEEEVSNAEEEVEEETQGEILAEEEENTASGSGYEAESDIVAAAVLGTVDRQDVTPGTQQIGHMNIDGTGLFGKVKVSGDSGTSGLTGVDMEHTGTNPRKWRVGAQGSQLKGSFAITDITTSEANPKYRLTINKFGKVGIGTKRPKEKLHVNGNVKANNFIGNGSGLTGVITTESDPIFSGSAASGITAPQIANWNTAFSWGDHTIPGYLTGYTETDPVFGGSPAFGITAPQISNWNTAYGWGNHATAGYLTGYAETDPQVGANTLNYVSKWDGDELVTGTIFDDGGKVGIGDIAPEFKLSLDNDGGIIAKGTYGSGAALSTSGAGTRMIWYPKKAAFRAGYVSGTQWDDANIGAYSIAMGRNAKASGSYSTALGWTTTASGSYSTALGRTTTASGSNSIALGYDTMASGSVSTATGRETTASGYCSTAMGWKTTASEYYSTALGITTIASGYGSTATGDSTIAGGTRATAMGTYTTASGYFSTAMGLRTTAPSYAETAIGVYATSYTPTSATTWVSSDRLFSIGNGTGTSARSNAMTVLKNGDVGIGTTSPVNRLSVIGDATSGFTQLIQATHAGADGLFVDITSGNINRFALRVNGNSTSLLVVKANGEVGIGTSLPNYKLHVNGTAYATGAAGALSDIRHKKNVQPVSDGALDIIDNLRPVTYEWKDPSDSGMEGAQIGFIAQEVEKVLPEVVLTQDDEDKTKGLKYTEFIPVIVKAMQEVRKENASLEQEINDINAVNEAIRRDNIALKAENKQLRGTLTALADRQAALEDMFLAVSTTLTKEKLVKLE